MTNPIIRKKLSVPVVIDPATTRKKTDMSVLDAAILRANPELKAQEITAVRSRIIQYVANGLDAGFDLALIKTSGHSDEIKLKVLKIRDDKL